MAPQTSVVVSRTTRRSAAQMSARRFARRHFWRTITSLAAFAAIVSTSAAQAQSNNVRITQLSDVAFGSIANLGVDATHSQNVCVFAHTAIGGYRVTATGSAPGGAFGLSSGTSVLPYEVQWNASSGQSSGALLSPNVPLSGLVSSATHQTCNNGPSATASLILVLRSTALSSATSGSYAGTLTVLIGPE